MKNSTVTQIIYLIAIIRVALLALFLKVSMDNGIASFGIDYDQNNIYHWIGLALLNFSVFVYAPNVLLSKIADKVRNLNQPIEITKDKGIK